MTETKTDGSEVMKNMLETIIPPKTEKPDKEPKKEDAKIEVDDDLLDSAGVESTVQSDTDESIGSGEKDWTEDVTHKSEGARQNFDKIVRERDEARAELARMKSELEKAGGSEWKEKYEQAQKIVEEVEFTKSDYFKKNHVDPLVKAGNEIETIGKEYGLKQDVLVKLATATPEGRLAILDNDVESSTLRSILANKFVEIDSLRRSAKNAIDDHESRVKAKIVDANTQIHADKDLVKTAIDTYFEKNSGNLLFDANTKNEDWNRMSASRKESVIKMAEKLDPETIANGIVAYAQIETLQKMFENERKKRKLLEDQLSELRGGEPRVSSSRARSSGGAKKDIDFRNGKSVMNIFKS